MLGDKDDLFGAEGDRGFAPLIGAELFHLHFAERCLAVVVISLLPCGGAEVDEHGDFELVLGDLPWRRHATLDYGFRLERNGDEKH